MTPEEWKDLERWQSVYDKAFDSQATYDEYTRKKLEETAINLLVKLLPEMKRLQALHEACSSEPGHPLWVQELSKRGEGKLSKDELLARRDLQLDCYRKSEMTKRSIYVKQMKEHSDAMHRAEVAEHDLKIVVRALANLSVEYYDYRALFTDQPFYSAKEIAGIATTQATAQLAKEAECQTKP